MLLVIHIILALSGLAAAAYSVLQRSRQSITVTYMLMAGTLASGFILVWISNTAMLGACVSGLAYSTVCLGATVAARHRIAAECDNSISKRTI